MPDEPQIKPTPDPTPIKVLDARWLAECRRITAWGYANGLLSAPKPTWDQLQEAAERAKVPPVD